MPNSRMADPHLQGVVIHSRTKSRSDPLAYEVSAGAFVLNGRAALWRGATLVPTGAEGCHGTQAADDAVGLVLFAQSPHGLTLTHGE
jgi:hypothetical protein